MDDNNCDLVPDLSDCEDEWRDIFLATPTARLNALSLGANLSTSDSLNILELFRLQSLFDG